MLAAASEGGRMRILGVGASCDLGDMYLRLAAAGHDVRVYIRDFAELGVMDGLLERVEDFRAQLGWVREAGEQGVIVFETAEHGAEQDALRREGFAVIGGSAFGDRLENDRAYGQAVLAELGMSTLPVQRFDSFADGIAFIRAQPGRYVFKLDGGALASWRNYVGAAEDGSDVIALLLGQEQRLAAVGEARTSFVLMRHVTGVETGIGAYFNGERFLTPACLDWEHKRFFPHDLGELTGEMGTLVTYEGTSRLFELTLAKLAPRLRDGGYVGYINLNTIINAEGIWPLELTCRFGYPGFAILSALQIGGWDGVLRAMLDRQSSGIATAPGYALGVVLTVPPFPYSYGYAEISKGLPIMFQSEMTDAQLGRLSMGEVAMRDGQLIASGAVGYLMVATGVGSTVREAQADAYAIARRVIVPNLRYRTDIGDAFLASGQLTLRSLGYLA
jgi:phosphoribosylamine--glycine ligase